MLVAVIVLFAICWAPTLIDNVLVAFEVLHQLHYGHLKYMRQAFVLMSYINSCINPIVYAFMSKNFRDSFKYALRVCIHGKQYVQKYRYTRQASFQTRSTSEGGFTRTSVNKDYDNELNSARSLASSPFVAEPEDKKIVDGDALLWESRKTLQTISQWVNSSWIFSSIFIEAILIFDEQIQENIIIRTF